MTRINAPRGAPDVLPPASELLAEVEAHARALFDAFGYRRIDTPVFEHTEVFVRSIGASSDIVRKEMYTFADRSGRSLTLRPEGTAPVVRAFVEHDLGKTMALPVRLSYSGPMFRYERPQQGRQRQFLQMGVECIGSASPMVDAEVVVLGREFYAGLGLDPALLLNSTGCPDDRARYAPHLAEQLGPHAPEMCEDCRHRLQSNPLRVFDCKVPHDREIVRRADPVSKFLCEECRAHLDEVRRLLDAAGVAWEQADDLVRGIDYYTRTIFEFDLPSLGARSAVGGGGRYDGLVEELGGDPLPGVGMAIGVEPTMLALQKQRDEAHAWRPDVYVAWLQPELAATAITVSGRLRREGLRVTVADEARSLRAQLRAADRLGASRVVILGPDEVGRGAASVRDLQASTQEEVALEALSSVLRSGGTPTC